MLFRSLTKKIHLQTDKKILEEEGWFVSDGKLMKDGKHFEFEFLIVSPSVERIALAFQKTLEVLGITMNVRTVDSSQYQARLLNYDFDMIKASWNVSLSPGNEQQFYYGSEVGKKEGSRNYAGVDSKVVGSWKDGKRNGQGIYTTASDGYIYVGEYRIGSLWNGSMKGKDGTIYYKLVNWKKIKQ